MLTAYLIDWTGASPQGRQAAKLRFMSVLERELGAGKVQKAHKRWQHWRNVTKTMAPEDWPPQARQAIALWERAAAVATREALDGLPGRGPEAWFEVLDVRD